MAPPAQHQRTEEGLQADQWSYNVPVPAGAVYAAHVSLLQARGLELLDPKHEIPLYFHPKIRAAGVAHQTPNCHQWLYSVPAPAVGPTCLAGAGVRVHSNFILPCLQGKAKVFRTSPHHPPTYAHHGVDDLA